MFMKSRREPCMRTVYQHRDATAILPRCRDRAASTSLSAVEALWIARIACSLAQQIGRSSSWLSGIIFRSRGAPSSERKRRPYIDSDNDVVG